MVTHRRNALQHVPVHSNSQGRYGWHIFAVGATLTLLGFLFIFGFGGSAAADDEPAPNAEVADEAVELPGKRTATSNTFLLPGGELETRLFQTPVNYRDEDGDWKPIDESLDEGAAGGLTNAANSFDLQLPDQLGTGSVRLSQDDQWLSYRLLGAQTEQAEVEGATAVYDSAGGDLSFELHSLANGVKEEIVLADNSQPRRYNFALDFAQDLSPSLADDGSIRVEESDGTLFATLPAPTISDASGAPPSNAVHYSLQEGSEAGHWTLAVEADETWLSDPDRAWPVTIDPSAFIFTEQDCSIGSTPLPSGWSACGNNGAAELTTAYSQIEKQPVRTFLRFKLGAVKHGVIPWNAYVKKATLKLYAPKAAENTLPGLETRRVTKDWNTTINWQRYKEGSNWTAPGGDFTSEGKAEVLTSSRGSQAGWWEFNSPGLRELVEAWIEYLQENSPSGVKNQGVLVKQIDETRTAECESSGVCPKRYVTFNSSAAASNKPELDVIYYPKAPSTNKLTSPTEGITSARRLMLRSTWAPGVTGVSYQYRAGKKGQFSPIPPALLRNAKGEAIEELAVSESCCQSERLYFDAAHVNSELQSKGGVVQVRALFEGGTGEGVSDSVEAKIDRYLGGPKDETTSVGPGTLDLLTGNLNLVADDVSIGGFNSLSFSRSYNTRVPGAPGEMTILGQGWKSGAEAAGSDWLNLTLTSATETIEGETETFEYANLKSVKGKAISFEKVGESYEAPAELAGYSLVLSEGKFVLTTPEGDKTTFGNENSGNGAEYLPISMTQLGSAAHSTVMTWAFTNGMRRLVREVTPTSSRTSSFCAANPTTTGCRTLEFTYAPATKWGAPSAYGDRLEKITFYAPGEEGPWEVAAYDYDNLGRLVSAWDPRIGSSLKNTYTYEGEKLRKVGIAGQEPWTFEYTPNLDGETGQVSRLKSVKRSNLLGGETKTSIRYEVGLSGSGAPNNMSASSVATWGQTDLPTDATAVFPPTEVPSEPATSYAKATLFYMDYEGFGVNAVTPSGAGMSGPAISTTETDEFGNVTRELTPQNRLRALAEPEGKRVERSHLLESKSTYSTNGTELLEERGPLHRVKLQETGEIAEARLQRSIAYENPAKLNPAPLVPTREVTGAVFPNKGTEVDQRVTEYKYDWNLRAQTEVITDAGIGHLNIRHKTAYDANTGFPSEVRQPQAAEESGDVPGAIKTTYFEDSTAVCPKQQKWSGLPCKIAPAAQPGSGPGLPITWIKSYSPLGKPTEIVEETPGAGEAGIRKTVNHYDDAGRLTWKKVTGGGQSVPKVEYLYSSTNGMLTTQQFVCETGECTGFDTQATTTTFDALGRVEAYEDADGNKSKTTYDSFGRPSSFYDGKGTQTVEYDPATSLITKLTDSAAGTFTASYDVDGNMVKRGLPDGLTAETTIDPTGAVVGLTYIKASNCGVSCTWLSFANDQSIYGQNLAETSSQKTNRYVYDRAGRLSEAQETPAGGNCTTRSYGYDKDSNRLSMSTIASTLGSKCGTGSTTEKKYSYDKADRLVDSGVVYDNFGRITTLPAADAGGSSLTTSYFATDMVATQSQNGVTNSFELDASLRQRSRLQGGGGLEGIEIFHYGTAGDSPFWTQRGSAWTRNIVGIGGELVALQESGKEITLPLTDLHGDVVATAAISTEVTALKGTFAYDEFGNRTSGNAGRFGWAGGMQRRTELPSGIVQMGVRSYVPTIGRFLSSDPVGGGSANAYDYGNADPVNESDPAGTKPWDKSSIGDGACKGDLHVYSYGNHFHAKYKINCNVDGYTFHVLKIQKYFMKHTTNGLSLPGHSFEVVDSSEKMPHNPAAPRFQGEWGNWYSAQGETFECTRDIEYQYLMFIIIRWTFNGVAIAGDDGKGNDGGIGEEGGGTLELKAQEVCGHGGY
jgi:RHS repeat-associated protein